MFQTTEENWPVAICCNQNEACAQIAPLPVLHLCFASRFVTLDFETCRSSLAVSTALHFTRQTLWNSTSQPSAIATNPVLSVRIPKTQPKPQTNLHPALLWPNTLARIRHTPTAPTPPGPHHAHPIPKCCGDANNQQPSKGHDSRDCQHEIVGGSLGSCCACALEDSTTGHSSSLRGTQNRLIYTNMLKTWYQIESKNYLL